ncbi:MAG: acyl-CoA dehydrogenase family protein [Acidobacteriota bacterium]
MTVVPIKIDEPAQLIETMRDLARGFARRAAEYDSTATFPAADFDDIVRAGLHAPTIPREYGGLGLGPFRGDVYTLWMLTKEVARADLSLARCWEGHANSLVILDGMANDEQKRHWFRGVVERGEKWVAWSGEPPSRAPGEKTPFGTNIEKVDGGWIVDGSKAFCTSAGGADWAILLVHTAGPGGARHSNGPAEGLMLMACDLGDPSVSFDGSWWNPIGMRATVSHLVKFARTFIPDENVIGYPGQYLTEAWQTCFAPHYAASFLGAAEAAYDYALDAIKKANKGDDPYVTHRVAHMGMNVETAHLWLRHVARLWETGDYDQARLAGARARHLVEHLAQETVEHAVRACGARALNRPSPVERIYRDLAIYIRHDNDDQVLATIGRALLGKPFDASFYKP